eukprot:CAMPEP_0178487510 /NCGR_PEP_ID=MMETSP0696-20121128/9361_1 /TAXON_ID=265572 /ORGANISM="Extubocellulus spinifer, Strain CCMP396" /LENGTH=94 /DNA_ID=CAMNT_0020115209 /DNA_START=1216 /DNA_END=1501 /DNA_ORIENTATION=+
MTKRLFAGGQSFIRSIKAVGNIESWLMNLLKTMQETLKEKEELDACVSQLPTVLTCLRPLVDDSIAQFALLAVQIMCPCLAFSTAHYPLPSHYP